MSTDTPSSALDLDAIRARVEGVWSDGYWPRLADADLRALLAEAEQLRAELAEVTRQRDEALETLENIRIDRMDW